jgi:ParB family chromosome partitioning protein
VNNKSLGRGLSAFLNTNEMVLPNDDSQSIININVDSIVHNPYQPRQIFDEESLMFLSESIKRNGVLQPILVIKLDNDNYQLIAGERRLRASKMAGMQEIPAILMEADKKKQLEISILENIQREDLNLIDEADSYKKLIDEFHYTHEQLSDVLGKSRSHITNILRLLLLPDSVKQLVREKKLTFGHARALVGLENAEAVANQVVLRSMSVRQVEDAIKSLKNDRSASLISTEKSIELSNLSHNISHSVCTENYPANSEILNIAEQISSLIGLAVSIKLKNEGGTVEIAFKNFEELDSFITELSMHRGISRVASI